MEDYKYLVTYKAINNDTYVEETMTLLFERIPSNIKKIVKDTYNENGVWEPQLTTIRVYNLSELAIDFLPD